VHPHHLSLALPRLLSPSISPTPLLNDIGEGAMDAMSEALRQGVSHMMDDLLPDTSPQQPRYTQNGISSVPNSPPSSPKPQRRIPMPAGFPGYTPSNGNTPLATPQIRRPDIPEGSQYGRPQPSTGNSSARMPQVSSSAAGSSQFRFRGQFAGPATPGLGSAAQSNEQRRVGALNAR
jgi:maintenance of morphology protein 1